MKKVIFMMMLVLGFITVVKAQNDTVLYIENYQDGDKIPICVEKYPRVLIYAQNGCNDFTWRLYGDIPSWDNPYVIERSNEETVLLVYDGCDIHAAIRIVFKEGRVPSPFTHTKWKHNMETDTLVAVGHDSIDYPFNYYSFLWSTGETTRTIEVTEPGTYTCEVFDPCSSAIRTFNVKDNVEISLATCDLETNHNMVIWPVTTAQAEYIDHIIVNRDGIQVGTANYTDGQFIDAIGSDAASRTYTIIAVTTDGTECPIVSYPKETIHMSYTLGMGNTIEMGWNTPTGYDLLGYNICEWNPNDDNLSVIDFVGASVTSYTCQASQFDHGNIVIQGVENGKTESRLLSNRSWETVGFGEQSSAAFKVYPNPSNGIFTVEGTGTLRIANVLGQEIIVNEIEGNTAIELPQGIYFVRLNGVVRKIVVE